jgi:hypothetical protein
MRGQILLPLAACLTEAQPQNPLIRHAPHDTFSRKREKESG